MYNIYLSIMLIIELIKKDKNHKYDENMNEDILDILGLDCSKDMLVWHEGMIGLERLVMMVGSFIYG